MCYQAWEIQIFWLPKAGDYLAVRLTESPKEDVITVLAEREPLPIAPSFWIPRQSQLKEVMRKHFGDEVPSIFDDWMQRNRESFPLGMTDEQYWLAFLMAEKYDRYWNGGEWQ